MVVGILGKQWKGFIGEVMVGGSVWEERGWDGGWWMGMRWRLVNEGSLCF